MKAEKMDRSCWPRIEAVIGWAKMSTNGFARHIGLRRGENLYQIKRGNNGISLDVASRIVEKFPEVDKLWLLTGEGQMLVAGKRAEPGTRYYFISYQHERGGGNYVAKINECTAFPLRKMEGHIARERNFKSVAILYYRELTEQEYETSLEQ